MKLKYLLLLTILVFSISITSVQAATPSMTKIKVAVNNDALELSGYLVNNTSLVPARAVLSKLKISSVLDTKTKTLSVKKTGLNIKVTGGKQEAILNGKSIKLNTAPKLIGSEMYIPLAFLADALGGDFTVDFKTHKASILTKGAIAFPNALTYEDNDGYSLKIPSGWKPDNTKDGLVIVTKQEKEGLSAAFFRGIVLNKTMTTEEALMVTIGSLADYLKTDININIKRSYNAGKSVVAEFSFTNNSQHKGLVNFTIESKNAFLSGMLAPVSLQKKEGANLVKILQSFKYRPDLMPILSTSAPLTKKNDWESYPLTTFTDPKEGAFKISVPKGWLVSGGTFRPYIDAAFIVEMVGENDTAILFSRPYPPFYIQMPDWSKKMSGLQNGSVYSSGNGMSDMIVADYMDAATYLQQVGLPTLISLYPNDHVKLVKIIDASAMFEKTLNTPGVSQWSGACAVFTDSKNRTHVCYLGTFKVDTAGGSATWATNLYYFRAPTDQAESFQKLFDKVYTSFTVDPQWKLGESNEQLKRSKIYSKSLQDSSDIINSTFQNKNTTEDKVDRDFSNVIRGTTDVVDTTTGETFKVPNDSNFYWRNGDTIIGTETYNKPASLGNFAELKEW